MVKLIKSNYRISNGMFGKRVTKWYDDFFSKQKGIIIDSYYPLIRSLKLEKLGYFCNWKLKSTIDQMKKLQQWESSRSDSSSRLDSIKILRKDLQNFTHFQSTKRKMYKFRVRGIPFVESFNNTVKPHLTGTGTGREGKDPTRGCVSQ